MWRAGGSFEVRDLGDNTVLIFFEDEADVARILMQGPWSFDKYLIGLYRPGEETNASFDWTSSWVQIHGYSFEVCEKRTQRLLAVRWDEWSVWKSPAQEIVEGDACVCELAPIFVNHYVGAA